MRKSGPARVVASWLGELPSPVHLIMPRPRIALRQLPHEISFGKFAAHTRSAMGLLLVCALIGNLVGCVNAARMDIARPFSADSGFNITVASLGSRLHLKKSPANEFTFDFAEGSFHLIDEDAEEEEEEEEAEDVGEDEEDEDVDPSLAEAESEEAPSWERELWSGDQVSTNGFFTTAADVSFELWPCIENDLNDDLLR